MMPPPFPLPSEKLGAPNFRAEVIANTKVGSSQLSQFYGGQA